MYKHKPKSWDGRRVKTFRNIFVDILYLRLRLDTPKKSKKKSTLCCTNCFVVVNFVLNEVQKQSI